MQVRRNTDFTSWPSTEGQTGSQHALEGKTMFSSRPRATCAHILQIMADYRIGAARVPVERKESMERFAMWRRRLVGCIDSAQPLP